MQLYIQSQGRQQGPYPLETIRSRLSAGSLDPADLAWHEGLPNWLPLAAIPEAVASGPPALPATLLGTPALPTTSGLAIASLICGLLSFVTAGITSIPAVVCGHLARARIRNSAGTRGGDGMALGGLILGYLMLSFMALAVLAGITAPLVIRAQKDGARAEAIANAKSTGFALFNFAQDYGDYPSDATAAQVLQNNPQSINFATTSSNACFRQLFAGGIVDTENSFHARIAGSRPPDGRTDGGEFLAKGECGYAYMLGADPRADLPQPLMLSPLVPGTRRFDPKPFGRKAVILWTNQNVTALPIARDGRVMHQGIDLLDPAHPMWAGKPARLVEPE